MVNLQDWSLSAGPLAHPPASSLVLEDIVLYPPEIVADAILSYPGMRLKHPADPTWWDWVARWDERGRWIEVGFTLFDTDPPAWGGSGLDGCCELTDILELWSTVRNRVPACWMHNTLCEIHTPESFAKVVHAEPSAAPDHDGE